MTNGVSLNLVRHAGIEPTRTRRPPGYSRVPSIRCTTHCLVVRMEFYPWRGSDFISTTHLCLPCHLSFWKKLGALTRSRTAITWLRNKHNEPLYYKGKTGGDNKSRTYLNGFAIHRLAAWLYLRCLVSFSWIRTNIESLTVISVCPRAVPLY